MAHQMPNPIALYEETARGFRTAMAAVKEAQMSNPTPCTQWNVQALLSHNIKVTDFVHGVFIGQMTVNPMEVSGPLPKEGPLTAFDTGVSRVLDVVKVRGALDKQLSTPFGPMTGAQFLMAPFLDLLIHRWDLAKATGQNIRLEPHLVEVGLSLAPLIEGARKAGVFATAVAVSGRASPQDKLISLSGRRPQRSYLASGGYVCFGIGRMDRGWQVWSEAHINIQRLPSTYLRSFYYDCLTHSEPALRMLIDAAGADRVIFGTDWPADMAIDWPVSWVLSLESLTPEEKEAILWKNPERLLGL